MVVSREQRRQAAFGPVSLHPRTTRYFQREYNLGNQAAAAVQAVLRSFFTLA